MGWFDENHPMGEEALARQEEVMNDFLRAMGRGGSSSNRSYRDPVPANASPMKRVERPESEWDETKWPKSRAGASTLMAKGKVKTNFLLTDKDLLPLSYTKKENAQGYNVMKMYNKREVERKAWEKYGGPTGLEAALRDRSNGVKVSPTKSAPKKAKSSISKSNTSTKQTVLGSSSGRAMA